MIKAVKGTRDILPDEIHVWHRLEGVARELFSRYGYREIRTPIFERTELFARGIGADTDIVSKEMYTFADRGAQDAEGESLTLRPEATAGIVRALIELNLSNTDPLPKVYALGPMFRRERPQKGRYRQFHQVDVEAFGMAEPTIDAEVIELALEYLKLCGLAEVELVLNSVGDRSCRPQFVETLRAALRDKKAALCGDCRRRADSNPLRVLDCKVSEDQATIDALPRISDHLCEPCRVHFGEVRRQLALLGIPYVLSHRLVRGLDYYTRTTFEVTSGGLGAQNSVLGGGRYDGLVKDLGGPDVCGIGFAIGMERLAMLAPPTAVPGRCDVFLVPLVVEAHDRALLLQRQLRDAGIKALLDTEGRSFKARMKLADKLGAGYAAILGDDEMKRGAWSVRDMAASTQADVAADRIVEHFKEKLLKEKRDG
ncbi:MAG TPA: histidine--tRNA ligase [Vicinamibacteria bacterium]|nr:histidine--tRNA ligase [Vicinamibacteria bacterium]